MLARVIAKYNLFNLADCGRLIQAMMTNGSEYWINVVKGVLEMRPKLAEVESLIVGNYFSQIIKHTQVQNVLHVTNGIINI
jgi:hypothetical protein